MLSYKQTTFGSVLSPTGQKSDRKWVKTLKDSDSTLISAAHNYMVQGLAQQHQNGKQGTVKGKDNAFWFAFFLPWVLTAGGGF